MLINAITSKKKEKNFSKFRFCSKGEKHSDGLGEFRRIIFLPAHLSLYRHI